MALILESHILKIYAVLVTVAYNKLPSLSSTEKAVYVHQLSKNQLLKSEKVRENFNVYTYTYEPSM